MPHASACLRGIIYWSIDQYLCGSVSRVALYSMARACAVEGFIWFLAPSPLLTTFLGEHRGILPVAQMDMLWRMVRRIAEAKADACGGEVDSPFCASQSQRPVGAVCAVLCCLALRSATLCWALLCCAVLPCVALWRLVLGSAVLCCVHCAALCCTELHRSALCCVARVSQACGARSFSTGLTHSSGSCYVHR